MMHGGPEHLRLLRRYGFIVASAKSSHPKLRHQDGRQVILPYCNSQYPKKTYFDILKQSGLKPARQKSAT